MANYSDIRKKLEATRAESEAHAEALRLALLLIDAEGEVAKSATAANKRYADELRVNLHAALQKRALETNTLGYAVGRLMKSSNAAARENSAVSASFFLPDK